MTDQWFAIAAYNAQTLYGWGTTEEAARYAAILNEGREINLYAAYPTTEAEAAEHGIADLEAAGVNLGDALAAHDGLR